MKNDQAKAARDAQFAALAAAIDAAAVHGVAVKLLDKSILLVRDGKLVEELGTVCGPAEATVAIRWLAIGLGMRA